MWKTTGPPPVWGSVFYLTNVRSSVIIRLLTREIFLWMRRPTTHCNWKRLFFSLFLDLFEPFGRWGGWILVWQSGWLISNQVIWMANNAENSFFKNELWVRAGLACVFATQTKNLKFLQLEILKQPDGYLLRSFRKLKKNLTKSTLKHCSSISKCTNCFQTFNIYSLDGTQPWKFMRQTCFQIWIRILLFPI